MPAELKPFRIGDVEVASPVVLAPLAGYSDLAYRLICRRLGAPYCTTEMLLDRLAMLKGKYNRRVMHITAQDHPIAGQIIGNDPDTMAQAAEAICEMGFDVVDLNFACPVNKALRRRRGGYLMREPDKIIAITRAVLAASSRPVTLKLRQKFAEADDAGAFWRIAEAAIDAGAGAICVHARSVEAKYFGRADWGFLTEVSKRYGDSTIIGSGDVLKPADALRMLEQTGVSAAAVARGALGNPWFFRQVRDLAAEKPPYHPPIAEQRELLREHFAAAIELYGPDRGPKIMRKFGIKYARMHPQPRLLRQAFIEVRKADDWHKVLEDYYTARYDIQSRTPGGDA